MTETCPNCGDHDVGLVINETDVVHCGCYYDWTGIYAPGRPPPRAPARLLTVDDIPSPRQLFGGPLSSV